MIRDRSARHIAIRISAVLVVAGALFASTGCGDLGDGGFGGADITSATIEPSEVPYSDRAMGDQCFTVEMSVSGFDSELQEITLFLVDRDDHKVTALPGSSASCQSGNPPTFQSQGNTVTVTQIGQDPMIPNTIEVLESGEQSEVEFGIGADVAAQDSELTKRNITSFVVFQN